MRNLLLMLSLCFLGSAAHAQLNCNNVSASVSTSVSGGTVTMVNNSVPVSTNNISTVYVTNWGDNNSNSIGTNATLTHTYNTSGTYTIMMYSIVGDSLNSITCYDTTYATVNVTTSLNCNNVNSSFSLYRTNNNVALVNSSLPKAGPGLGVQFNINWGDNNSTTTSSTGVQQHTYTTGGSYTVTMIMTVVDSNNNITCHDTATKNVNIPAPGTINCNNVNANFTTTSNLGNVALYNYSSPNTSSSISASYDINWGDGNSTTATSKATQNHTYGSSGGYTITMIATYTDGINTCIDTTQDTVSINTTPPNILSGTIIVDSNSNNQNDSFKVWLITFNSSTNILAAVDSQVVSGFGYAPFAFTNKASGTYRVKAHHLNGPTTGQGYVPTYHDSALLWSNAQTFTHNGQTTVGKNIYMKKGAVISGAGFIAGNVNQGANKGTASGVPGITMLLLDANGTVLAYTVTDANGHYSFSNLPPITYQVHPEEVGYATTAATVTLGSNNATLNDINFERSLSQQTIIPKATGIENINSQVAYTIFPNPAQSVVNINWGSASEDMAAITITDISGKKVLVSEVLMGNNTTLDVHSLHTGLYFLTVATEAGNTTQKLIIE